MTRFLEGKGACEANVIITADGQGGVRPSVGPLYQSLPTFPYLSCIHPPLHSSYYAFHFHTSIPPSICFLFTPLIIKVALCCFFPFILHISLYPVHSPVISYQNFTVHISSLPPPFTVHSSTNAGMVDEWGRC